MAILGAVNRTKTTPIPIAKTIRRQDVRNLTSFLPGKFVPIHAFPLFREDRLRMSRFRLNFEQMETAEILMNAVAVRVRAYLVPFLAFNRFNGIDQLNRSWMKQPETDGGTVQPFFNTAAAGAHGTNPILLAMGKHAKAGVTINTSYVEAYNEIWNFLATNRSPDITLRAVNDTTLAKAFWNHQQWAHVVPDFDQALIDGEVPLNVVNGQLAVHPNPGHAQSVSYNGLPLKGLGTRGVATNVTATTAINETGDPVQKTWNRTMSGHTSNGILAIMDGSDKPAMYASLAGVYAELEENGITVSLSNIEVARKTQAFAALRRQYTGHTDDYIIDMLMNGITVPEQAWRQPILLADRSTIFGMNKRYSTTADDLTASVVNGGTFLDISLTTPTVPMGGIVMITAEVTPEQLFERQMDPWLYTTDQETLPEFLRDTLDPEKVTVVQNQYVDVQHATPTGTFGYAPLNHQWNQNGPGIGGKFFRPTTDAPTDEARMRIWAVETANPTLSEDFYLCTNMHTKPFVVTNQDPYEVVTRGLCAIEGNTVFGNFLIEASDDYDEVMSEVPMDRIDKPNTELEEVDSGVGQSGGERRGVPSAVAEKVSREAEGDEGDE